MNSPPDTGKLLPCPFPDAPTGARPGHLVLVEHETTDAQGVGRYRVTCACGASGPAVEYPATSIAAEAKAEAIRLWNTRAIDAAADLPLVWRETSARERVLSLAGFYLGAIINWQGRGRWRVWVQDDPDGRELGWFDTEAEAKAALTDHVRQSLAGVRWSGSTSLYDAAKISLEHLKAALSHWHRVDAHALVGEVVDRIESALPTAPDERERVTGAELEAPKTFDDVVAELRSDSPLNKARQQFSSWSAKIEQAGQQRMPLAPVEIRRMEFEAVVAVVRAAFQGEG